jgi:hypothetical protein
MFLQVFRIEVTADAHAKFMRAIEAARPIYEILHIATLTQEASELASMLLIADDADRLCFCSLSAPTASRMVPSFASTNSAW